MKAATAALLLALTASAAPESPVAARHQKHWLGEMRSPLLDEGLSDYIAALREPAFLTRREAWIAEVKVARGIAPPAFDELLKYDTFYQAGDIDPHYWLSGLLMRRLIGSRARLIPKVLDAQAKEGDAVAKP